MTDGEKERRVTQELAEDHFARLAISHKQEDGQKQEDEENAAHDQSRFRGDAVVLPTANDVGVIADAHKHTQTNANQKTFTQINEKTHLRLASFNCCNRFVK